GGLDELRLALALLGASRGEIRLGGDLVPVQLAALRLRLRQLLRQLVALARELLRARLQLLLLRRRLLQSPAELGAALLQVDEIRAVIGQSREDAHRLVPFAFHRVLRVVDFLERRLQRLLGLLLARLVLGGGIGQLLLLQAQPLLFAPEQLEAHSEERDLLLVLRLAGSDGLPLPLGELHLLLGEAELLVDGVGLIGQLLHLLLVLEELEPLRGEARLEARGMRERDVLGFTRLAQLPGLPAFRVPERQVLAAGGEQLQLAQLRPELAEPRSLLCRPLQG